MRMSKADIGRALDSLREDVIDFTLSLVAQYRAAEDRLKQDLIEDALDNPHRARAQITFWISSYDARFGAGAAQTFLAECLAAAGSAKTLSNVNTELAALETSAQAIADDLIAQNITASEAADLIDAAIARETDETFAYQRLKLPPGYQTIFGRPRG